MTRFHCMFDILQRKRGSAGTLMMLLHYYTYLESSQRS